MPTNGSNAIPAGASQSIGRAELARRTRAVDERAVLTAARVLRRIIKESLHLGGFELQAPHSFGFTIQRDDVLRWAAPAELGFNAAVEMPATLILLREPNGDELKSQPAGETLCRAWQAFFHERVHLALEEQVASGKLTVADVARRFVALGDAETEEVREVLRQTRRLLPSSDSMALYIEFAASFFEFRSFAPRRLECWFPSLPKGEVVAEVLKRDADIDALLRETRPEGAAAPGTTLDESISRHSLDMLALPELRPSKAVASALGLAAEIAFRRGNDARAAILRARAHDFDGQLLAVDRLARRIQTALGWSEADRDRWRPALAGLAGSAARGFWTGEAKLLYDLQKACVDHERALFAVDLVGWVSSLGRWPLRRRLGSAREVRAVRSLRKALERLPSTRLPETLRRSCGDLLHKAIEHAEESVRLQLRPKLEQAMADVGLRPRNYPEAVAGRKFVEELLDRIVEHGRINMGDVRDAVARNQLKINDLSPGDLVWGDALLQLNRKLEVVLDGVYHGGEIYMRALQQISSLGFATVVGRLFVLYLVIPFGGAFLALEGWDHTIGALVRWLTHSHLHVRNHYTVVALGLFLLPLLYVGPFQRRVFDLCRWIFRGLRTAVYEWPLRLLRSPWVYRLLHNRVVRFAHRYLLIPVITGILVGEAAWLLFGDERAAGGGAAIVFLLTLAFLGTRAGRDTREALMDWLGHLWERIHLDLIPGLFRWVMDFFRLILETLERFIYAVDEQLRFREGESRIALVVKPVLGLIWFVATYVVRIYVQLLIEPTVNPIKHFPVVTVAHKIMLPFIPTLTTAMAAFAALFVGEMAGWSFALFTIFFIPGIFGFLVWEFKENWRLYDANRAKNLKPVIVGHHGETIKRFLRPGIHSGTIPKLFAKLRNAERQADRNGDPSALHKQEHALEHNAEAIRHFVDREFVALVNGYAGWSGTRLGIEHVRLGTNTIRVELVSEASVRPLTIRFMYVAERLRASIDGIEVFAPDQQIVLRTAFDGICRWAAVDMTANGPLPPIMWTAWNKEWEAMPFG